LVGGETNEAVGINLLGQGVPLPVATIAPVTPAADEDSGTSATFRVSLDQLSSGLTVNYSIGGSAQNGVDYVSLPGSVTIPANQTSALITITPIDDLLPESTEDVIITLAAGTGYTVGNNASATVTIVDNELTASITASDPAASEGGDPGSFTIQLNRPATNPVTVAYSIGGTATAGSDYQALPATVTIPAGQQQADLPVIPLSDNLVEPTETVTVTLQAGSDYLIGSPASASVDIADGFVTPGQPVVSVIASDPDASEQGLDPGAFTVSLDSPFSADTTVTYNVAGSATSGVDYQPLPGSVTITAGQLSVQIPVTPLADTSVENTETIQITLNPGSGYSVGTPASATVNLTDERVRHALRVLSVSASVRDA
jgi:hypothetical protein